MRVLLSTIGSRGDVQPVVALALRLRELRQEVRVCAPPDFRDWIEGFGIPFVPIGPEVRSTARSSPSAALARPSAEQLRQMMEGTVATQFATIPAAAEGCGRAPRRRGHHDRRHPSRRTPGRHPSAL